MAHGLRTIAFQADLVHPPVRHEPRTLQALHAELFGDADGSYRDFRLVQGGAQLSNALAGMPGAPVSCMNVLADRIQLREEQTGAMSEDFERRMAAAAGLALSNLPMNAFLVQHFVVRAVVNPDHTLDARQFVAQAMCGFQAELEGAFGGGPSLAGVRFAFPPRGDEQGVFNLRIESFSQDNRSLFLETAGTFSRPVQSADLEPIGTRFRSTCDFLHDEVVPFVARFDVDEAT